MILLIISWFSSRFSSFQKKQIECHFRTWEPTYGDHQDPFWKFSFPKELRENPKWVSSSGQHHPDLRMTRLPDKGQVLRNISYLEILRVSSFWDSSAWRNIIQGLPGRKIFRNRSFDLINFPINAHSREI